MTRFVLQTPHSSPHLAWIQPERVFLWQAHGTQGINHRTSKIQILWELLELVGKGAFLLEFVWKQTEEWLSATVWSTLPGMKATQSIAQPRFWDQDSRAWSDPYCRGTGAHFTSQLFRIMSQLIPLYAWAGHKCHPRDLTSGGLR